MKIALIEGDVLSKTLTCGGCVIVFVNVMNLDDVVVYWDTLLLECVVNCCFLTFDAISSS